MACIYIVSIYIDKDIPQNLAVFIIQVEKKSPYAHPSYLRTEKFYLKHVSF